jgi:hypothetical protein
VTSSIDLGLRSFALLGLAVLAGEDNKACLVVLQALRVEAKRLGTLVSSSVVNSDADSLGNLSVDASLLHNPNKWKQ